MISLSHTFDVAMCSGDESILGIPLGPVGSMGLMGMGIAKLVLWE